MESQEPRRPIESFFCCRPNESNDTCLFCPCDNCDSYQSNDQSDECCTCSISCCLSFCCPCNCEPECPGERTRLYNEPDDKESPKTRQPRKRSDPPQTTKVYNPPKVPDNEDSGNQSVVEELKHRQASGNQQQHETVVHRQIGPIYPKLPPPDQQNRYQRPGDEYKQNQNNRSPPQIPLHIYQERSKATQPPPPQQPSKKKKKKGTVEPMITIEDITRKEEHIKNLKMKKELLKKQFDPNYPKWEELTERRKALGEILKDQNIVEYLTDIHNNLMEMFHTNIENHFNHLLKVNIQEVDVRGERRNSESDQENDDQDVPEKEASPIGTKEEENEQEQEHSDNDNSNQVFAGEQHEAPQFTQEEDDKKTKTQIHDQTDQKPKKDDAKERYKPYGLVISASIKGWVKEDSTFIDDAKQRVIKESEKIPFIEDDSKVDASVRKALSMTWSMLTLLPPLLVTTDPQYYSEEIHDTNRHTWDEDERKIEHYYRPVLVYGNTLHVAVKGLVGNSELMQ